MALRSRRFLPDEKPTMSEAHFVTDLVGGTVSKVPPY